MTNKKISVSLATILCLLFFCTVSYGADKKDTGSDTWLEAKLVTSYTLNQHLNPFKIDVDVVDGVAIITGTVDSEIERDLAVEIARGVEGIKEVKDNLTIEQQEKTGKENEFAMKVDDAIITARVKYRLMYNKNTEGIGINVDTENNVVTLTGTVDSSEKKDLTLKLAQNTSGVVKVKDKLTVAAAKEMSAGSTSSSIKKEMAELSGDVKDTWITTKAKSILFISNEADGAAYDVTTQEAKITVTGTVLSEKQAAEIQQILEDLQGVNEVQNKLQVR